MFKESVLDSISKIRKATISAGKELGTVGLDLGRTAVAASSLVVNGIAGLFGYSTPIYVPNLQNQITDGYERRIREGDYRGAAVLQLNGMADGASLGIKPIIEGAHKGITTGDYSGSHNAAGGSIAAVGTALIPLPKIGGSGGATPKGVAPVIIPRPALVEPPAFVPRGAVPQPKAIPVPGIQRPFVQPPGMLPLPVRPGLGLRPFASGVLPEGEVPAFPLLVEPRVRVPGFIDVDQTLKSIRMLRELLERSKDPAEQETLKKMIGMLEADLRGVAPAKTWTKASSDYIKQTRHEFEKSGGVREQFWKNEFAKNREAYKPQNQALIKQGKAPFGTDGKPMVIHHKTPIEYGGTNDVSNLQPMRYSDHSLSPNFGPLHTPPFPE